MFMQRILIASIGLLLTLGAYAQQPTPTQQERVQEIMELLQSNPEVIDGLYDSLLLYVAEKEAGGSLGASEQEWLIDNPAHPWLGAEQPQLTIVNFTDYNCPFCKRLESVLEQVRAEYPQVQVVNINLSLRQQRAQGLDTNSALYALQVWRAAPQKYPEVHSRLMAHRGNHTGRSLNRIAKDTSTAALLKVDDTASEAIERNQQTFRRLGFRGTPTLLVGNQVVPGFVPYERLQPIVEQALKTVQNTSE